eukprot:2315093-Prymnesium_polylepis.1
MGTERRGARLEPFGLEVEEDLIGRARVLQLLGGRLRRRGRLRLLITLRERLLHVQSVRVAARRSASRRATSGRLR